MNKIKLTVFTQITYFLGDAMSYFIGCELYNIAINHLISTIGYFVGLYGLSIFYNSCCVNKQIKVPKLTADDFNPMKESLNKGDEQLFCEGVIHHTCKHFCKFGLGCNDCKIKKFEAR